VRREAALALALFVDTEAVPAFVAQLTRWQDGEREAKVAAAALGKIGDVRGLGALIDAYAGGLALGIVAEALAAMGPMATPPLIARIEADPSITSRRGALAALEKLASVVMDAALDVRKKVAS
jgi:HEAT repeat protein